MIRLKWRVPAAALACAFTAAVLAPGVSAAPHAQARQPTPPMTVTPFSGVTLPIKMPNGDCASIADYTTWIKKLTSANPLWKTVRIQSTKDCNALSNLVPAAKRTGIKINVTVWAVDQGRFEEEKRKLEAALRIYGSDWLNTVSVGSESLYRNEIAPGVLVEKIRDVKGMVQVAYKADKVPVGTSDTVTSWADGANTKVVEACDFVGLNIFPYWLGKSIGDGLAALQKAVNTTKETIDGKPIIVTETGWPSAGPDFGAAAASLANEKTYFNEAVPWLQQQKISDIWFSGWDEPQRPPGVEQHWGVFDRNSKQKFSLGG